MTRISAKSIVLGFVVLVTVVVFGLMAFGPSGSSGPDPMGDHDMGGMSMSGAALSTVDFSAPYSVLVHEGSGGGRPEPLRGLARDSSR